MITTENWGLIDYDIAWEKQRQIVKDIQTKRDKNVLVFCQHPTVITIGRNGTINNVLSQPDFLKSIGIKVIDIDRGGDVTMHNPGQLVGYPIFNLSSFKEDLHWFLRQIESAIIDLAAVYGIKAGRVDGLTGVWVDGKRKLCAMGMHCSRWVTSHGFALNVNNNLSEFNYIVPCGIQDKGVTSLSIETGQNIDINSVAEECQKIFERIFRI